MRRKTESQLRHQNNSAVSATPTPPPYLSPPRQLAEITFNNGPIARIWGSLQQPSFHGINYLQPAPPSYAYVSNSSIASNQRRAAAVPIVESPPDSDNYKSAAQRREQQQKGARSVAENRRAALHKTKSKGASEDGPKIHTQSEETKSSDDDILDEKKTNEADGTRLARGPYELNFGDEKNSNKNMLTNSNVKVKTGLKAGIKRLALGGKSKKSDKNTDLLLSRWNACDSESLGNLRGAAIIGPADQIKCSDANSLQSAPGSRPPASASMPEVETNSMFKADAGLDHKPLASVRGNKWMTKKLLSSRSGNEPVSTSFVWRSFENLPNNSNREVRQFPVAPASLRSAIEATSRRHQTAASGESKGSLHSLTESIANSKNLRAKQQEPQAIYRPVDFGGDTQSAFDKSEAVRNVQLFRYKSNSDQYLMQPGRFDLNKQRATGQTSSMLSVKQLSTPSLDMLCQANEHFRQLRNVSRSLKVVALLHILLAFLMLALDATKIVLAWNQLQQRAGEAVSAILRLLYPVFILCIGSLCFAISISQRRRKALIAVVAMACLFQLCITVLTPQNTPLAQNLIESFQYTRDRDDAIAHATNEAKLAYANLTASLEAGSTFGREKPVLPSKTRNRRQSSNNSSNSRMLQDARTSVASHQKYRNFKSSAPLPNPPKPIAKRGNGIEAFSPAALSALLQKQAVIASSRKLTAEQSIQAAIEEMFLNQLAEDSKLASLLQDLRIAYSTAAILQLVQTLITVWLTKKIRLVL